MTENGPDRKVANSLVALSSAAIIAVYAAGYVRTRPAADLFDLEAAARRRRPPPRRAVAVPVPSESPLATSARPEPASAAPTPKEPAPAKPAASVPASPKPKPVVAPSPSATPRPLPPKVEAPSPTPAPPPEAPAQPASAEPVAVPLAQPATTPVEEALGEDAVPVAPTPPADAYTDGVYTGWGSCRHGDLQVELTIQGGRIAWASIAKCYTRYPCSWVEGLVPEVVDNQGAPVTFVSGASDSSDALYYAVLDALSNAK